MSSTSPSSAAEAPGAPRQGDAPAPLRPHVEPGPGPDSPLGVRDFRLYFGGQFVSLVGMWMQMGAMGWIFAHMTESKTAQAMVGVIQAIPMGLLGPHAGVLADRRERRRILIVTQALMGLLALGASAFIFADQLTLAVIYGFAFIGGCIAAFDFPAMQGIVPQLVPPRLIPKAVALNGAIFHGSRAIGFGLAGLILVFASPGWAFVGNAASYLAVIYSLLLIAPRPPSAGLGKPSRQDRREGFQYVKQEKIVGTMIALTALVTALLMPVFAVFMPMVATQMFHAKAWQYGMLAGASGLGAFTGAFSLMRVPADRRGRTMLVTVLLSGSMLAVFSRLSSPFVGAAVILVMNFASSLTLGLVSTVIQVMVPDRLRGRVMGIFGMTFAALMPPCGLLWGVIADATSLRAVILGLATAFTLGATTLLMKSGVYKMGAPSPAAH
jgi:MFS family permease